MPGINLSSIFIILVLSIVLLIERNRYINRANFASSILDLNSKIIVPNVTDDVIINKTRKMVHVEMWDYKYSDSGVEKLEDLLIEHGGKPIRSLIVSTWRSGSSFLGELLNMIPGNFYNYEPLMKYRERQIRGPPLGFPSSMIMKEMLKCNFQGMEEFYFEYAKKIRNVVDMILINKRLWSKCSYKKDVFCYSPDFVSRMCKLFPFQSMKTVRFRLPVAKYILDDDELNARVVLLVRDPRAVMQSRKSFCYKPDCIDPQLVCADMVKDYEAAISFTKIYPDKFMALRYEDLILNLDAAVNQLLRFLRLSRTPSIDKYLQTHTTAANDTDPFSTFRVSREIPFKWRKIMDFSDVEKLQVVCRNAMAKWGYLRAHNASHLTSDEFYPLRQYTLISQA